MATLLVWDIDGTLIRGNGTGRRAMSRAFERLFGEESVFEKSYLAGGLDHNIVESALTAHGLPESKSEEFFELYLVELARELGKGRSMLLQGVKETLEAASNHLDLHSAVGTGNIEPAAHLKLGHFQLQRFFPVGGYSEGRMKRSEVLAKAVENAKAYYGVNYRAQEVVVIGDTLRDIEAAREIGARVVSVTTGDCSEEELREYGPDLVLRDLTHAQALFSFCLNL